MSYHSRHAARTFDKPREHGESWPRSSAVLPAAPPAPLAAVLPVTDPERIQRAFLGVLVLEIQHNQPDLTCGLITRDGEPVVFVVLREDVSRRVEIACRYRPAEQDWPYVWAEDGQSIGYPGDERSIADTVRHYLRRRLA